MKQLSSAEVRQLFLDFFKEKGHTIEPSAPLVPNNDPTILWINSGVATMKNTLTVPLFRIIQEWRTLKNPSVQMTLKTSVKQRVIIHSLKC